MTIPEVFIIESLSFKDEEHERFEGRMISDILHLNGKSSQYFHIRTKQELIRVLKIFRKSKYRYLHLSCHGNRTSIFTTLDVIKLKELGEIIRPYLYKRRLFISSCEMSNESLAKNIIPQSECISIVGPSKKIAFSDAAITWSSFYHLMFKYNRDRMNRSELLKYCERISDLFGVSLNYYSKATKLKEGYKKRAINPVGTRR